MTNTEIERMVNDALSTSPASESQLDKLLSLTREHWDVRLTDEGYPIANPVNGIGAISVADNDFTNGIVDAYYERYGKAPTDTALKNCLRILTAKASKLPRIDAYRRCADVDGILYIDSGTDWVIRVDDDDWNITDTAPVVFLRNSLTKPLARPCHQGIPALLSNLILTASDDDWHLLLCWLVKALGFPGSPTPMLTFANEQGTGKTTATKIIMQIVDPKPVATLPTPTTGKEAFEMLSGAYASGIDNVSYLSREVSDQLCRAVTEGGATQRGLYTNFSPVTQKFRGALIINGITIGSNFSSDLADRMLPIELERITPDNRRTEASIFKTLKAQLPEILGGVLDLIVNIRRGLISEDEVDLPRMGDFGRVVATFDKLFKANALEAYRDKVATVSGESVESNPFIAHLMENLPSPFDGKTQALLDALKQTIPGDRTPRWWPTARKASEELRRSLAPLRMQGWYAEETKASRNGKTVWHFVRPTGAPVAPF